MKRVAVVSHTDGATFPTGGITAHIREFIRNATDPRRLAVIGSTTDANVPLFRWTEHPSQPEVRYLPIHRTSIQAYHQRRLPYKLHIIPKVAWLAGRLLRLHDVIYTHNVELTLPFLVHPGRRRARVVMAIHGHSGFTAHHDAHWFRFRWFKRLYWMLEDWSIRHVDAVVLVSADGFEYYVARYPRLRQRLHFVPNGVDVTWFAPRSEVESRRALGLPEDALIVIATGRLSKAKDWRLVLDAFVCFQRVRPAAHLVIAGDGELREEFQAMLAELDMPAIHWLGEVPLSRLPAVYCSGDVYLLASLWEGMPMSLLEALACGLPAVTTDVGECANILEGESPAGIVVRSRRAEDLARALDSAVQDKYLFAPRQRAMQFSAAVMADTLVKVLDDDCA